MIRNHDKLTLKPCAYFVGYAYVSTHVITWTTVDLPSTRSCAYSIRYIVRGIHDGGKLILWGFGRVSWKNIGNLRRRKEVFDNNLKISFICVDILFLSTPLFLFLVCRKHCTSLIVMYDVGYLLIQLLCDPSENSMSASNDAKYLWMLMYLH